MSRFLFASTDFIAHCDWGGMLATARELVDNGHDVMWASGPRVGARVNGAGVGALSIPVVDPFHGGSMPFLPQTDRSQAIAVWQATFRGRSGTQVNAPFVRTCIQLIRTMLGAWLRPADVVESARAIGERIDWWHPDVVIAEPFMVSAALAAEQRGIPLASCGYPGAILRCPSDAPFERERTRLSQTFNDIRAALDLQPRPPEQAGDLFFSASHLQIVYLPPDWYGQLRAPSAPRVEYVGGSPVTGSVAADSSRTVVVATSTSYHPSPGNLLMLFDAIRRVDAVAVLGGHPRVRAMCEPLPPHVRWDDWVNYEVALPKAAAIVHHGGLGTTHAAVRAGTPQVVLPEFFDQCLHAEAVSRAGAGVMDIAPITSTSVEARLRDVMSCSSYKGGAERLCAHFASFGGVARAARLLEQLPHSA